MTDNDSMISGGGAIDSSGSLTPAARISQFVTSAGVFDFAAATVLDAIVGPHNVRLRIFASGSVDFRSNGCR